MTKNIDTIIFDLGGVLVDWNPKYLYSKVFEGDTEKMEWFLREVCTADWNIEQDAGRTIAEATDLLVREFPEYEEWIALYYTRWEEMIRGTIPGTVEILDKLKKNGHYRLYALTNWSHETFPVAREKYDFLKHFEGIVVSGEEKTRKPFDDIYEILLSRYEIIPGRALFIDDNPDNVAGAKKAGIHAVQFHNPSVLIQDLKRHNIHF
jgi:2-haloacid dehalogenase